jgi:predicted kinase
MERVRRLVPVGAALILLNGPPASGKSTLAERLVSLRPLALNLDIDLVRGQLGGWLDQPAVAGLAARALAISMINTHLGAGYDVVVPQLLARPDFIEQLEGVAVAAGAEFVEIALDVTKDVAISAFEERRRAPTHPTHRDASDLVERSRSADPVAAIYDALQLLLETRPTCHRIDAPREDIDKTLTSIRRTLSDHGLDW